MLEGLDAVLDVGGVYDHSQNSYDHHQKGFDEVFGYGFSLSLAALVLFTRFEKIVVKLLKCSLCAWGE